MNQGALSSLGSVAAAIAASLCCIGPLFAAFAGIGSIGAFSIFDTYRPYFIGLTVILLAVSLYRTYRKREAKCEDGSCRIETGGKWDKIAIWSATLVAAVAIAFPSVGEPLLAFTGSRGSTNGNSATVILRIEGMDSPMCAGGLEASLARIGGVQGARISLEKEEAVITYDPTIVEPGIFISVVKETGFRVRPEKGEKGKHAMDTTRVPIQLLFFDDCPNHIAAEKLLREVLVEEQIDAPITRIQVETPDEAHLYCFVGSPTIRFNGKDIDPGADDGQYSLRCRLYQHNGSFSGLPNKEVIRAALLRAFQK